MFDDMNFEYDDMVEFIAEFLMVFEAARIHPHVYIQWYDRLSNHKKLFLSDVRAKQLEFTMKVASLEEEAKRFEEDIINEVNDILRNDDDNNPL
jgi:hypothetical protein